MNVIQGGKLLNEWIAKTKKGTENKIELYGDARMNVNDDCFMSNTYSIKTPRMFCMFVYNNRLTEFVKDIR